MTSFPWDLLISFFSLQIYWLKDRVEVQPERDSNYIQAADGHLIIIQAREKDRANYTCVAENVANRRLSPPARLNIHGKSNFLTRKLCKISCDGLQNSHLLKLHQDFRLRLALLKFSQCRNSQKRIFKEFALVMNLHLASSNALAFPKWPNKSS